MSSKGVIIITGASGGVGAAATEELARRGESVVMACRNCGKAAAVREKIIARVPGASIDIEELHLDSFASVRSFAARMQERDIKALFNNAGVISRGYRLCEDGYEESLTVNFLSPYLLTRLLLPQLETDGRVVNMVSLTCNLVKIDEGIFEHGKHEFSQLGTYSRSKLALLLFSLELARRSQVSVNLADPGIVDSGIISLGRWFDPLADVFFRPLCKTPAQGAVPAVNALMSQENGRLFKGSGHEEIRKRFIKEQDLALHLWEKAEKIVQIL